MNEDEKTRAEIFLSVMQGLTRPAVTLIFAATLAVAAVYELILPGWFQWLAIGCIVWWFGNRTWLHAQENRGSNND